MSAGGNVSRGASSGISMANAQKAPGNCVGCKCTNCSSSARDKCVAFAIDFARLPGCASAKPHNPYSAATDEQVPWAHHQPWGHYDAFGRNLVSLTAGRAFGHTVGDEFRKHERITAHRITQPVPLTL
jgi:hypothetical protein